MGGLISARKPRPYGFCPQNPTGRVRIYPPRSHAATGARHAPLPAVPNRSAVAPARKEVNRSGFVTIGVVMHRPIDEMLEFGGTGRAVQILGGKADKGAGKAAMLGMATAFVREQRGVEHGADGLQILALKGIEKLQLG